MKAKRTPRSDNATVEARRSRLIGLLSEGFSEVQAADILRQEGFPGSDVTIRRDVRTLAPVWGAANAEAFDHYRQKQLEELESLRAELKNDKIKPDRRIDLALSILDREIRLLGTEAPSRSVNVHQSVGHQLDSLYLDIREALLDLDDVAKQEALQMMRNFALTRRKPVTITAQLMENNDAHVS